MEHDLKSLQVFIEGEFRAVAAEIRADRQARERMHTDNVLANAALVSEVAKVTAQTTQTNGRVRKMEIAVAVLKFAVFTIGGGLLVAGIQVWIAKFTAAVQ